MATELFKVKNDLFLEIMKETFVFQENEAYHLRSGNHESVSNLGAELRNLLPREIKIVLPSPFSKIRLENELVKNFHASFVRCI